MYNQSMNILGVQIISLAFYFYWKNMEFELDTSKK